MTTTDNRASVTVPPSPQIQALGQALAAVAAMNPAEQAGSQALADAAALIGHVEAARAVLLPRLADVQERGLHTLDGAPSTASWIEQQQTSISRDELALARRLRRLPLIADRCGRAGWRSVPPASWPGRWTGSAGRSTGRTG